MTESIIDDIDTSQSGNAKIKVIGIGGGGGNAVNEMISSGLVGVQFICANTDLQVLSENRAPVKIPLGEKLTKGLGAGADPEKGKNAAAESINALRDAVGDADMLFITAGMGGGTGTGAAPIMAQAAHEAGILTVGVVTKPFSFEGKKRMSTALGGIEELKKFVDCLIVIPNDRLITLAPKKAPFKQMLQLANQVLKNAVQGITDVIQRPGIINLDFADIKSTMMETGLALMGTGRAKGENRAKEAAQQAIMSPFLEDVSLDTAKSILYNITSTDDISMEEITEIGYTIQEAAKNDDINIIFGCVTDKEMGDELQVTVIATGIEPRAPEEDFDAEEESRVVIFKGRQNIEKSESRPLRAPRNMEVYPEEEAMDAVIPPQRIARRAAENWDEISQASYSRKRDLDQLPKRVHTPGSVAYTYDSEDREIPAFLRINVD